MNCNFGSAGIGMMSCSDCVRHDGSYLHANIHSIGMGDVWGSLTLADVREAECHGLVRSNRADVAACMCTGTSHDNMTTQSSAYSSHHQPCVCRPLAMPVLTYTPSVARRQIQSTAIYSTWWLSNIALLARPAY